jgi:choice-of-anchor B domain-containing protein
MRRWSNWQFPTANAYNDCWGFAQGGREYAIIGSNWGTHFLDVTNPVTPISKGNFQGTSTNVIWRDFKTYQNYAYGVSDGALNSLQIFDLQYLPDSVVKVYDSDSLSRSCHNIYIDGNRLYLADNRRIVPGQGVVRFSLEVLSLANPTQPVRIGTLNTGGLFNETHDVHVRNDTAYCSGGFQGLFIYDYRNAAAPVLISSITNYPEKGYNHSAWLSADGNKLVFADETHGSGLKLYDVTNKTNPVFRSIFRSNVGAIAHNPFILGDSVYISYYHDGGQVFSLADSSNVLRVAYYDTYPGNIGYPGFEGAWGIYPFLPSRNVLVSDISTGLHVTRLLPVTSVPNATFSIGQVSGCGPFQVKLNNLTIGSFTNQWTVLQNGQPVASSSDASPTIALPMPGTYLFRLVAGNSVGTDTSEITQTVGVLPAATLPYAENFDNQQTNFCLEKNAQSEIQIASGFGVSGTFGLEFRGGEGLNYNAGLSCDNTFNANPTYISKAGIKLKLQGSTTLSLLYSIRSLNIGGTTDTTRNAFRIKVNGTQVGNCQRITNTPFNAQNINLSSFIPPGTDTLYVEFEAVNRFYRPGQNLTDRIVLDNVGFTSFVAGLDAIAFAEENIALFPNPAKDMVLIQWPAAHAMHECTLEVTNRTGSRCIASYTLENGGFKLNTSNLSAGLYTISIRSGDKVVRKQLAIMR